MVSMVWITLSQEGLAVEDDFPKDPDWKPFSNLTWLQVENDKRRDEEYLEKRKEFYEQRCWEYREATARATAL